MDEEYFLKGMNEYLILKIISDHDSYAYEINKIIANKTNGYMVNEGLLYTSLKKLEKANVIESYWNDDGGKRRKFYCLTSVGIALFNEAAVSFNNVINYIDKIGE